MISRLVLFTGFLTSTSPEDAVPEPDSTTCHLASMCAEKGCYMFPPRSRERADCMYSCRMLRLGYATVPPKSSDIPAKTLRRRARKAALATKETK